MRTLLLALLLLIGTPSLLYADYSVTPQLVEHTVEPRAQYEESIKISNLSDIPVRLFPTVNAITLGEDGEILTFVSPAAADNSNTVTSWIQITRGRLELAPGESIKVPLRIVIDPKAKPGEYYAFVGFGEGSKRDEVEARVLTGTVPGVIVRLTNPDTAVESIRLNKFVVDRFVTGFNDAVVTYSVENLGDTTQTPRGEIILYNVRGEEVGTIPVNPEGKAIEPKGEASFTAPVPDTTALGRHKAFLNLEYGVKQSATVYDTTFFTVVPLMWLLIIFGLLLTSSIFLSLWYHFRQNRLASPDDEDVLMYVRQGVVAEDRDHDINLKQK
jgi:hypothetical protein